MIPMQLSRHLGVSQHDAHELHAHSMIDDNEINMPNHREDKILTCRVRRLFSSVTPQARIVSSSMKSSQALANNVGPSELIIWSLTHA